MRALKPIMLDQMRLHRGQRVLEVGCGTGDDVRTIARRVGPSGHVLGIDASPLVVAEATRRSQGRNLPVDVPRRRRVRARRCRTRPSTAAAPSDC